MTNPQTREQLIAAARSYGDVLPKFDGNSDTLAVLTK